MKNVSMRVSNSVEKSIKKSLQHRRILPSDKNPYDHQHTFLRLLMIEKPEGPQPSHALVELHKLSKPEATTDASRLRSSRFRSLHVDFPYALAAAYSK